MTKSHIFDVGELASLAMDYSSFLDEIKLDDERMTPIFIVFLFAIFFLSF
jgi:hypothetical protein